ncbi:HET-domain-containing protein [Lojkania enalia]|uniref:HET-domain-containing protein n=1 Tax=Lojkania enalia TaxID=147567 RepID=A0A9P4K013_9PLEO|nr:HET-domain-containing protein [Didymosphaeria enalia]
MPIAEKIQERDLFVTSQNPKISINYETSCAAQYLMASSSCTICRNLSPSPRLDARIGVKFMSLRQVYDKASQGCGDCKLLWRSFEAVVNSDVSHQALAESGKWSSVDARVVCDYLEEGGKKVELRFQRPEYKLRVELYGVDGSPNPRNFTLARPENKSQGSTTDKEIAGEWISHCVANHVSCGPGLPSPLPKRILDISRDPRRVFLHEPQEGVVARYACLSYCWGTSHTVMTTQLTFESHKTGIAITSLPKTFRDSIAFARGLSLDFLWIDSMCIIQDSTLDWRAEAAKMAQYYSNAYLTLAATISSNSDGGLFTSTSDIVLSLDDDDSQTWIARPKKHLQIASPATTALFGRGWIFQERLLSPRVLHFCDTELCFECCVESRCECGQDMPDQGWQIKQEYLQGPTWRTYDPTDVDIWHRMVEAYCRLKLTKGSDKLPALAGLADQMRMRRKTRYVAGLWEDSLLVDLLWAYRGRNDTVEGRVVPWRAPSWSWASVEGTVRYGNYPRVTITYTEVLGVNCQWVQPSTTGELLSGVLILEGPVIAGSVRDSKTLYRDAEGLKPMNGLFSIDCTLDDGLVPVLILRIGKDPHGRGTEYFLVLREIDVGKKEFSRVGLLHNAVTGYAWSNFDWDSSEKRLLRIV